MYKIIFKNPVLPLIFLILTVVVSLACEYFQVVKIDLPIWILVGLLALFLFSSVILYSKASIKQYLLITSYMLLFAVLSLGSSIGTSIVLGFITFKGILFNLSVISLVVNALLPVIAIKMFVTLQQQIVQKPAVEVKVQPALSDLEPLETPVHKEESNSVDELVQVDKKEEIIEEDVYLEDIVDDSVEAPQELTSKDILQEEVEKEIFLEDIADDFVQVPQESTSTEVSDKDVEEDVYLDLDLSSVQKKESDKVVEKPKLVEEKSEEVPSSNINSDDFIELGELPAFEDVELEPLEEDTLMTQLESNNQQTKSDVQEPKIEIQKSLEYHPKAELGIHDEELVEQADLKNTISKNIDQVEESVQLDQEENIKPFIPKLTQQVTNKDTDSGAKITAIGKLLVDKRDIENIIETNALMQHVSSDATTTRIITPPEGEKITKKLETIKTLGAKDVIVVTESGFLQTSTIEDLAREQVIGAVVSGTYGVVSSSLRKFGFQGAKDVTFESSSGSLILSRLGSDITAVFIDKGDSLYTLNAINEILVVSAEMSPEDLVESFTSIDGMLGVVIASSDGLKLAEKLVDSSKKSSEIAEMLPAFYNNMSVFLKNLNYGELRRAIINTGNEILLFTDIGNNLILLYTSFNTSIEPADSKVQFDAIIG